MNYAPQIIEGLKSGSISRIMLVDDAYDAPTLAVEDAGGLLDFLQRKDLRTILPEDQFSEAIRTSAINALNAGELDEHDVKVVVFG